jgi:hypothetical protein
LADAVRVPLSTGRWRDVFEVIEAGEPLHWTPTRISLGTPKYLPAARKWPTVRELMPYGLIKLAGPEFEAAYRQRLDKFGVDALQARFEEVYTLRGLPLLLLCFENVHGGQGCHRVTFAQWWHERTGQYVFEASLPRRR